MGLDAVKNLIFKREQKADDVSDQPAWKMGVSLSATWAWGISIAIGIAIMHSKGILPFLVWVIPNVLAIPFFAFIHAKVPGVRKWPKWKPFLVFLLLVEAFAIVLNMKFIRMALSSGTDLATFQFLTATQSLYAILGIGLFVVLFINKTGFRGSVLTDLGQYTIQVLGALSLIVAGLILGTRADVVWIVEGTGSWWFSLSALATLFAILTHGGEWQRMESIRDDRERMKIGLYGGLFFGLYMLLVTGAGLLFEGTMVLSLIFLTIVLSVATSTMDSSVSAVQWISRELVGKHYWGTLFAAAAVLSWPLVIDSSVMSFWQFYADIRMRLIGVLLGLTVVYGVSRSDKLHEFVRKYGVVRDSRTFGS